MKHNSSSVSGLKNGDYGSYKALFEKCYGKLLSFVKFLVKDAQAAEDIVQDQFVKLWDNRQSIDECVSVESFLYVMTKNAALNYLKSRRKLVEIPEQETDVTSPLDLEHSIDISIFRDRMSEIIEQMPPQRKKVFTMSRIDGLSNIEIAARLGLSVKTVDRHLSLAKAFIKDNMSNYIS